MNKFYLVSALLLVTISSCVLAENSDSEQSTSSGPVKCYQCNSLKEPGCKDPFKGDDKYLKPCENGETFCRKIIQTIGEETSVIRQCAKELYKPKYEGCYKTAGKASQTVCTCEAKNNDKPCNNGFVMKSSIFAIVLSVFLSVLLF